MQTERLRRELEQLKGKRNQIISDIEMMEKKIDGHVQKKSTYEEAREILNNLIEQLQQNLQHNISELGTLAIETVFEDPYKLVVEFVRRRNKMECDIYFLNVDEQRVEPKYGGGGALDIASFALRIASWSMYKPRLRNVLILDEPGKHIKGQQANLNALKMIKELSEKQGLQIIMVSDERIDRESTMEVADRLFEVSQTDGISEIKVVK
jgi:hypothetical protein